MSKIKVAVRARPLSKKEVDANSKFITNIQGDTISVTNVKVDSHADFGDSRDRVKHFSYDYCYDSGVNPQSTAYASQELVFQDLGTEVLDAAFEGYNTCVLAYGQTSTGKTYTMMGNPDDPGLTPRICEGLFSHIDDVVGEKVRVDISYYEIYNERVRDLLRPSLRKGHDKYTLKVREHPKDGPYVQDLSSHCVRNNQEIQELLDRGQENRTTASTYMHDYSSRSHAIVTINYTQAQLEDDLPHEIVSKIHLVDLAGSERADPSWSSEYKGRLKEGSNINRSLVTLGNVIKALAEKSLLYLSTDNLGSSQSFQSSSGNEGRSSPSNSPRRRVPYIPYRDSVLTWLLKDSLGGNSKTIMIATVTPASQYYNETISTLRYAQRAKRIVNKPMINEDPNVALIRELRREIEKLRSLLASAAQSGSLVAVQDTGTFIAEKLRENEDMANKLTQTWKDKWQEAHDIIKESDLSIRGLNKRTSSMGVLIESQLPHLVGMDDDILSTGVMIYHLKEGKTLIGRDDAAREQDIVISGPSVQKEHCFIKNYMGTVTLYVNRGAQVTINGIDCKGPTRLTQGDYILLGKTNMFRFNNPAEAAKLRERRESQEGILSSASSLSSLTTDDNDNIFLRIPRQLSMPRGMNHQLERRFDSESERIEEARRELEVLNQEQNQTEDQRNESEERLWLSHERQRAEIEKQKIILAKLIEEVQIQKQKAEDEITFKRECLQKEKDAFQALLQEELDKIKQQEANKELVRQTGSDVLIIETPGGQVDKISQEEVSSAIQQRKLSLEGHIKTLTQGELLKRLSYKQIEQDFIKHEEELEDELEQSQMKIESQVLKLKQLEDRYKSGDEEYYQAISEKSKQLDDIHKKKEQLELYIEEKQDLLSVSSANPRPLRMACSEEVLTDVQYLEAGFPLQTNSLKNLQRGSEGDLPAVSQRFSRASGLNITSMEYLPSDISEAMEVSSDNVSEKSDRDGQKETAKQSKISNAAKRVTDRLYTAPPPKFKREAKEKKPTSGKLPKDVTGKKDDKKGNNEDDRKRRAGTPRKSPLREDIGKVSKSPSTKRKSGDSSSKKVAAPVTQGKVTTPVTQGRKKSDTPERVTRQEKEKSPPLSRSRPSSSLNQAKSKTPNKDGKTKGMSPPSSHVKRSATPPGLGHDYQASDDINSQQNIKITMSSPDLRLLSRSPTPADRNGRIFVSRMPATKLRHMASTPSLASVPEAVGEEGDAIEMPTSPETSTPQVVKRRNRRRIEGEKYKRHSAPVGEILANIFQNSGFSFTDNTETEENLSLTSSVQPVEDLSFSSNIKSGENITLPSSDVSDSDGGIQFTAAPSSDENGKEVVLTLDSDNKNEDKINYESESMDLTVNDSSMGLVYPERESSTKVTDDNRMECDSEYSINQNTNYISSAVININKDQGMDSSNVDQSGVKIKSEDLETIPAEMEGAKFEDEQVTYISEHSVCLTNIPAETQQAGKISIEHSETNKVTKLLPENSASSVVFSGARSTEVDFICPAMHDDADEVDGDVCVGKQIKPGNKREILDTDSSMIAAKCRKEASDSVEPLTSQQPQLDICDESSDSMLTVEQDSHGPQTHQHHIDFIESLEFGRSQGILHAISSTEDIIVCEDIQNVFSDQNTQNFIHKDSDDRFSSDSLDSDPERKSKKKNDDDVSSDSLNVSDNSDVMDSLSPNLSNDGYSDIPPTDNVLEREITLPTREVIPPASLSLPSEVGRKTTDNVKDKNIAKDALVVLQQSDTAGAMLSPIMEESKTENTGTSQTMIEKSDSTDVNVSVTTSDIADEICEDNRRTLGTCTSPDFTFPEQVDQHPQSGPESDDSLQEVQEQLQVLQEALDQKSPRGSNGSNTQLSSARKAVRQRAVIRQKQRGCNEESDDIDHLSDDSLTSESQPKSSSRPEQTSRRRRRINNKSNRKAKRWRGLSSEEYITSDSDGIYSDNSHTGQVEFSSCDNNTNDDNVTGENRLSDAHSGNYTPTFVSDLSDSDTKITVELTGCFLSNQKMDRNKINGCGGTSDLSEETREKLNKNKTKDDSESHSRSSSETRSVQTDISLIGNSNFEVQNNDGYYSDLAVSPLCIWNSGDKRTQYHQPHSKRTPKTKVEYVRKNKHPKQEHLAISVTDQWSAETSTSRRKSASSISSDSSYVMEMETLSPQLPSPSDRFIQEGQSAPPQDMSCLGTTFPVVYEVTVREDLTNVFYNVDRTEIKTYGLHSQINSDGAQIIPDSININLQETTTNSTEKRSETIYKEEVTFRNSDHQDSPVDSVISETNFRSITDISVDNPGTSREVCREQQAIVENSDRYIHPQCEANIQNTQDPETVISPRESDTTSDYGTLVESKLGNSSCLSGSQSTIPGDLEYSPMDDSVFHRSNEENSKNEFSFDGEMTPETVSDLQVGVNNIPQSVGESINYISAQGHQLCRSEDSNSNQLHPGVTQISRPPEHVSNVIQQNLNVSDSLNNNDKMWGDSNNKTLERTSSNDSDYSVEYSEEVVTLTVETLPPDDNYTGVNSESNESVNNVTPTQSQSEENVQLEPDTLKQVNEQTVTELSAPKPTFSLLSPQRSLKTVSVNTDNGVEQPVQKIPSKTTESSFREDLKQELQQKLARLQRHVRSLSDSAISSDFTDGDSTSASPRGSRLCESDKVLRSSGGFGVSPTFKIPPVTNIEVMTTQSDSRYEQSRTSPFTNSTTASLDIDKKLVRKSPFQDSGNVFDEDNIDTEEAGDTTVNDTEQEFMNNLSKDSEEYESAPNDNQDYLKQESGEVSLSGSEEIEYEEERSLSPGEIVLKPGIITSSELYQTFASGLISMDETGAMENQDGARQLDFKHKAYKEKSPSLSELNEHKEIEDFRRSMSENCIDQYEERTHSSNESIVFVFMGQSHTNESMEELKSFTSSHKEYTVHEDEDGNNNTNDDSNITNEENEQNMSGTTEEDQNRRNMSRSVSESENSVDTSPLRHRYGIDSNVLPIPERSISSDNLPKGTSDQPSIHRSRSADMLAVGVIEDPTGNEGVFPPCFNGDTSESNEDNMLSGNSIDSKTSVDEVDKQMEDEIVNSTQEILYAEIATSQTEHLKPQEVNYEGHISDDEILTLTKTTHKPESAERGVTTGVESFSPVVSVGVQVSLSDSSTQTDSSYNSIAGEFLPLNILPALESDYRAQSMVNIGEAPGPTQLNLSEGTEEWYNLSHMVLENKTILKNIKQNIPGMNIQQTTDSSNNNKDDSTQTGGSLTNLQSSGIQTDELFDFEEHKNESCASTTQTGSGVVSLLEIAEVESTDYRPSPPQKTGHDMSIQTVDFTTKSAQTREMSIQTVQTGPSESDLKFDFSKNVSSESKVEPNDSGNVRQGYRPFVKSTSEIKQQHEWHHYEVEQQEPQEETVTETIVYNISEAPEIREEKIIESQKKHESNKSDDQVVVTEREFRLATEVELPDLETSNAQMEALKKEHSKMMASLKKAADERKERVQTSKYKKRLSASMTRAEIETMRKEMETETSESNKSDIQSSSEDLKSENVESYSRPLTQEELEILMRSMARKASTDVTSLDKISEDYRARERHSWENKEQTVTTSTVTYDKSRYDGKKSERMSYNNSDSKRRPLSSEEEVEYPESRVTTSTVTYDKSRYDEKKNEKMTYNNSDSKRRPLSSEEEFEYPESKVTTSTVTYDKSRYDGKKNEKMSYDKSDSKRRPISSEEEVEYPESKVTTSTVTYDKSIYDGKNEKMSYDKSGSKRRPISSEEEVEYLESKVKDRKSWEKKENSTTSTMYQKSEYDKKENQKLSSSASEHDKIRPISPEDEVQYSESTFYIYHVQSEHKSDEETTDQDENSCYQQDKQKEKTTKTDVDKHNIQQGEQSTVETTYYSYQDINAHNVPDRQENQLNRNVREINKSNSITEKDLPPREISHRVEEVPSANQRKSHSSPWEKQRTPNEIKNADVSQNKKDDKKQTMTKMSDGAILNQKIMSAFAEQDGQTKKHHTNYYQAERSNIETSQMSGYREEVEDVLSDTIGSPTCGTPPNSPLAQGDDITNRFTIYNDSQITVNNSDKSDSSHVIDSSGDKSNYETMYSESIIPKSSLRDTTTKPQEIDSYNTIKLYTPKKKTTYDKSLTMTTESTPHENKTSQYSRTLNTNTTSSSSQPRYSEVSTLPTQELIMPSKSTRSYVSRDYVRDNRVSTGVEVCVDSSDDFTQTDLRLDLNGLTSDTGIKDSKANDRIKEDLERLQKERVEIIELLSLNYLPASLTIELLERKLNYCIGQTDLLLESLGENLDFEIHELNITTSHDTREYISKYKESLRQSKRDIEICKERMDRRRGTGRGRTIGRNRDLFRLRRNAEIEVFKAERSIEELKHRQEKTVNPWKNISASIHDRFDRSLRDVSPSSTSSTPRTMTPKQHRDHLIELRRQLVKATKDEDFRQRTCRSSSPRLTKSERDRYFGSSYKYTADRTRDRSLPLSTHYEAPIDHKTDLSYGISSYAIPPSYTESLQAPRSYSYDVSPSSTDYQRYDRSSSPYYSSYDYVDSRRYHSVDSSRTYSSPTYDNIPFYRSSDQQNDSANSSFGDSTYRYHSVDTPTRSDRSQYGSPGIDIRHHSLETNYQSSVNNYTTQGARSQSVDSRQDKTSRLYSPPLSREQSPHSITSFGAKYHSTGFESPTQQLINRSRSKVESRVYSPTQGLVTVQTKSTKTEQWYDSETEALLKEINEMKQQNQQEISRAKDNLVTYRRESGSTQGDKPIDTSGSSDSPNYDGERRRRRSYSSYKDYATDILQSSRQSLGSVSGTYELYDTSPTRYGTQSQNSSFMSEDLESLADSVQSENIHTYSQGYENKFKTTRPVRSTDLKSKVFLRKKLHL